MENYIAVAIIAVIVFCAVLYILRAKKRGAKCIGCPDCAVCKQNGCNGCGDNKNK